MIKKLVLLCAVLCACSREDPAMRKPLDVGGGDRLPPPPVEPNTPPLESGSLPPPISGGTLLVSTDGSRLYASDPDRDRVYIVELALEQVVGEVILEKGDEPGRLTEDAEGRVHVVLRGGGAIATIEDRALAGRRPVCKSARGITYDREADLLHVTCLSGQLLSLSPATGLIERSLELIPDLRDVVVSSGALWVSVFRSGEILRVAPDRSFQSYQLPSMIRFDGTEFTPSTAWRMVADPRGGVTVLHQRATGGEIAIEQGSYGASNPCSSPLLHTTVAHIRDDGSTEVGRQLESAVLAVDVALTAGGERIALASAGNYGHHEWVEYLAGDAFSEPNVVPPSSIDCPPDASVGSANPDSNTCAPAIRAGAIGGEIIAVAYDHNNKLIAQSREPARLFIAGSAELPLSDESRANSGHTMFHRNSGASIACASCHPEGGEDGRVWQFGAAGARRTQSLRGGLAGTEPLHWDGGFSTFEHLTRDVFTRRMNGPRLSAEQLAVFAQWIETIPALPHETPRDAGAVERGRMLFEDDTVACASCHSGPKFTNNATVDVGTGGAFQVPSLAGVFARAPYLHDGCAPTMVDRFYVCGGSGDRHGNTMHLTRSELDDLIAYLETL